MIKHLGMCRKFRSNVNENDTANVLNLLQNVNFLRREHLLTDDIMITSKLCEQILRIVASVNLSFSFAENPEFVALLQHAYSQCVFSNRRTLADKLEFNAERERERFKNELSDIDSKVSLALNCWSSRNHYSYLSMRLVLL